MTDPLRSDRVAGEPPDRERDARIEQLLLTGLDHYFAGQHELAINVWTRVLFLDRGHARARAYIERARSAASERQREADELLHGGADALARGDRTAARELLTAAVERGAAGEDALALLHRLDRVDVDTAVPRHTVLTPAGRGRFLPVRQALAQAPGVPARDPRLLWAAGGILAGILITAVVGGYLWIVTDPLDLSAPAFSGPVLLEDPLPVPPACELRLARAQRLHAQGRLREALQVLDAGDPDDRHRAGYDALRASIQRQLLAAARGAAPDGDTGRR